MGGRGSGKTLAGAAWVQGLATGLLPAANAPVSPIALVGESIQEVRDIMIDGPSGIMTSAFAERPHFEVTRRRLVWSNGAVAHVHSAHDPEGLRGPQFAAAWCDEICKWPDARQVWDMLQFGLRLGDWPRQLVTTTPRPIRLLRDIMADASTVTTHMKTRDNAPNLAAPFMDTMEAHYGGTRLGRQELDGELLLQSENALWSYDTLDHRRRKTHPALVRIVVAVDPPASSHARSDACGIVVAGADANGHIYVLGDHTVRMASPTAWAKRACAAYHAVGADALVAEVNQGGDMVAAMIATQDAAIRVKSVHARKSKFMRAEPIAALYENGRVHHVGVHAQLEAEMCDFTADGRSQGHSPDRVDALVWAVGELAGIGMAEPHVRAV